MAQAAVSLDNPTVVLVVRRVSDIMVMVVVQVVVVVYQHIDLIISQVLYQRVIKVLYPQVRDM